MTTTPRTAGPEAEQKKRRGRLRTRLSLALLLLALIPLAVTTAVLVPMNLGRLRISAKEYRMAIIDHVKYVVTDAILSASEELRAVGRDLTGSGSVDERFREVEGTLHRAHVVDNVSVYDTAGQPVDTLRNNAIELQPAPSLDAKTLAEVQSAGLLVQEVELDHPSGAKLPLILTNRTGAGSESDPPGRVHSYVRTLVDLSRLNAEVADTSRNRFDHSADRIYIIDEKLRIVVHGRPERVGESVAKRGIVSDLGGSDAFDRHVAYSADFYARGEHLLGAIVPLPELGLGVVVEQPAREAYEVVTATWLIALLVGLGFALVALLVGLRIAKHMAEPISAVAQAAARVAEGDFEVRVATQGKDEIGEMAGAFNHMARGLQDYEARVTEEARIRGELGRYLNHDLVQAVMNSDVDMHLGGERREVSVLFADVVAFTPLSESREPEEIVGILNELFTFLTEIVFRHGGIVDKFVGDCVMAVFGIPLAKEDHQEAALRAAGDMMRWIDIGNAKWRKTLGHDLRLSIGVNSGEVIAGNIGSEKRMEYTVIGDVVNVAARLESIARPGQVLLTRATMDGAASAAGLHFTRIGERDVTGRKHPVEVYTLTQ